MNKSPLLPVPPLAETANRYLQWVRPLLDEAEFAQAEQQVAQFAAQDGVL